MSDLPWASTGLEVLRTSDFHEGHLDRPGTYVVCFGAEWCGVTRRFVPKFSALRGALGATVALADITDRNDSLWDEFRIQISPSIIVFRDGAVLERLDGKRIFGLSASVPARLRNEFPPSPPPSPP